MSAIEKKDAEIKDLRAALSMKNACSTQRENSSRKRSREVEAEEEENHAKSIRGLRLQDLNKENLLIDVSYNFKIVKI